MKEKNLHLFNENSLSADDLAVLQAFEAMEKWNEAPSSSPITPLWSSPSAERPADEDSFEEEMLALFISEVEEDLARMQDALALLEQDGQINAELLQPLQRAAHKVRGTAGAVECQALSTIAHAIEVICGQITNGCIFPVLGVNALVRVVLALEKTLESVVMQGSESGVPLAELKSELKQLGIHLDATDDAPARAAIPTASETAPGDDIISDLLQAIPVPLLHIDTRLTDQLILHSERLTELHPTLESSNIHLKNAVHELQLAQARLQQLEPALATLLTTAKLPRQEERPPSSSLTARILYGSEQRKEACSPRKTRSPRTRFVKAAKSMMWDELDLEQYTARDMLIRSLHDIIADVVFASKKVHDAFIQHNQLELEYTRRATTIKNDIFLLRMKPLKTLIPLLQKSMAMSMLMQEQQIKFEVQGETTEIDQDILEALSHPLCQLLHICVSNILTMQDGEERPQPHRIWLHATEIGNEILLEIGFSMIVHSGAVEVVREPIQRLGGTISLQRNTVGGLSFSLRLPRSRSAARCLRVRVGCEQVIVPFAHVQRIGEIQHDSLDILYKLNDLLGFPGGEPAGRIQPVLILLRGTSHKRVGVLVDEVMDEAEFVVKPLPPYLQRPGIAGAAIGGKSHVLLMVNLPELISHYTLLQQQLNMIPGYNAEAPERQERKPTILIADDSVSLRHSLLYTLKHNGYTVIEAQDGTEAIEQLMERVPDAFLLDVEMPKLNGYEVLSLMRLYPELATVRVIMLTSRSSKKHIQ
jgi:chemotaxis protein histidine kinase CheA